MSTEADRPRTAVLPVNDLPDTDGVSHDLAVPTRALAIGAHPDDIEFGCGATLAKWSAAGCEVFHLVLTDGAKGTWDRNADRDALIATRQAEAREAAAALGSKDARIVCTAIAPISQMDVQLNIFNLSMYNQTIMGTVFGSVSPRAQVPRLLKLVQTGMLEIDELITREYTLDEVQKGYDDLAAGINVRGVVNFGTDA